MFNGRILYYIYLVCAVGNDTCILNSCIQMTTSECIYKNLINVVDLIVNFILFLSAIYLSLYFKNKLFVKRAKNTVSLFFLFSFQQINVCIYVIYLFFFLPLNKSTWREEKIDGIRQSLNFVFLKCSCDFLEQSSNYFF